MRNSIVGAISLLLAAACTSPGSPDGPPITAPRDVTVELDAFSGLPNPSWTLSASEAIDLAERLRLLPLATALMPEPAGLGYRGFRISNPGGEGGIPETAYVSRSGWIRVGEAGPDAAVYQDQRASQALLIRLAKERGYGEAVAR